MVELARRFPKFRKQETQSLTKLMLTTIPCADVKLDEYVDAFEMVLVRRCMSDIAEPYFKKSNFIINSISDHKREYNR